MALIAVRKRSDLSSAELGDRFVHAPDGPISEHYIYTEDGIELAFIAMDWWSERPYAVLYELFVPTTHRRQGIGTAALAEVEELVRSRGRQRVHLMARPLDDLSTIDELEAWYERRGYFKIPGDENGMFGKDL